MEKAKLWLFKIIVSALIFSFAVTAKANLEIEQIEGYGYSLTIHFSDVIDERFLKLKLDGHLLEDVVIQYCLKNNIDLSILDFDSESDLFEVTSKTEGAVREVRDAISKFFLNPDVLESLINEVGEDSPERWIDEMIDEGISLSEPIYFNFIVELKDKNSVESLCRAARNLDYICYFDDLNQVSIFVELIPTKISLRNTFDKIMDMSMRADGDLAVYSYIDRDENIADDLTDWNLWQDH